MEMEFAVLWIFGRVVNDSLVIVDFANRYRTTHNEIIDAVRVSDLAWFRAILLTSLKTFARLPPPVI